MTHEAVLLDTGFLIRLLNPAYPLHENAKGYFKYFLEKEIALVCSTISIAEFCVIGGIEDLPLKNLQLLPFNLNHAKRTGEFARIAFEARRAKAIEIKERLIIPNDTKLFSQADVEQNIQYYLTADTESNKIYSAISQNIKLNFRFLDLNVKYNQAFGILDL
jgi:predicted nucleic acid-binding protein